ncbi:MAG: hypothetical protein OEZ10_05790 [Gammaproteobacteria bacterium]|nr:hypothetical protein [Gammaproteobacteria bacterium]
MFDMALAEPGDKDGDGVFSGIFAALFRITDTGVKIFWAESGDYREWNDIFVGEWRRNGRDLSRKVVFSFHAAGLHTKLPYTGDFSSLVREGEGPGLEIINDKYLPYGWKNYDYLHNKEYWWK